MFKRYVCKCGYAFRMGGCFRPVVCPSCRRKNALKAQDFDGNILKQLKKQDLVEMGRREACLINPMKKVAL